MKFSKIALAVAAFAVAPAFAAVPANLVGAKQFWITGASAPTAAVFNSFMSMCRGATYRNAANAVITNPGTREIYMYTQNAAAAGVFPGTSGGNNLAFACQIDTADNRGVDLEGQWVVVYHTIEGGSFNAYSPALKAVGDTNPELPATLTRIPNVAGTAACVQTSAGIAATDLVISGQANNTGVTRFGCGTSATDVTQLTTITLGASPTAAPADSGPVVSVGGYSDSEYAINKANLGIETDLGSIGSEELTGIAQAFGVAVSYPLYYQLQLRDVAAGRLTAATCTTNFTAALPNITGPCQPTMPASMYTSLVNPDLLPYVSSATFGGVGAVPTGTVKVHRRVATSGTQSVSNLHFLHKPCANGTLQGELALQPASIFVTNSADTVETVAHSGSGDVRTALIASAGLGQWAAGVLSVENSPATGWNYVKLDGVSPNFRMDGTADSNRRANAEIYAYKPAYELVSFFSSVTPPADGDDLLLGINASLGNPNITNLRGLFITTATRNKNSCGPWQ